jgi:signal transduction histidine kinase
MSASDGARETGNMQDLFWNPLSINYLVEMIVIGVQAAFFTTRLRLALREKRDIRGAALLVVTFVASFGLIFGQFLSFSLPTDDVDHVIPWISMAGSAAMAGLVLYALHFNERPALGRWGQRATVALYVAVVLFEIAIATARLGYLADGHVVYRDHWTNIPYSLGFLGVHLFFVLHLVRAMARERDVRLRAALAPSLVALLWPFRTLSHDAAAARAFFYFGLTPLLVLVLQIARYAGVIDWRWTEILSGWITIVIFSSFTLVYLNYVPERSSFRIKVVGLTLVTILSIASGMSWLIGSAYSEAYVDAQGLKSRTALRFEPQSDGAYRAAPAAFSFDTGFGDKLPVEGEGNARVELPFDFPFFGNTHRDLFVSNAGMAGFNEPLEWRNILHRFGPQPAMFLAAVDLTEDRSGDPDHEPSGVYFKGDANGVVISWMDMVSVSRTDQHYTFQLRLHPTGMIEMAFAEIPDRPAYDFYRIDAAPVLTGIVPAFADRQVATLQFNSGLPYAGKPGEGIVDRHFPAFRAYLNRIFEPVALYILAASLIVILVFPLFFHINLIRPLQELIQGVRQIMGGKLSTDIRVFHHDEIGYLASSFNEMATAQNQLVQTLEDKVAARTAEASEFAARNARLEERNHLARELHDAVSQTLFSANLMADKLPDLLKKNPEQALRTLTRMQQLNRDALTEMRHLLLELRPQDLATYPFGKLLADIVGDFERRNDIAIELLIDGDAVLPGDVQLALCRIAQECLANVARHSQASSVSVYFDAVGGQALLSVSDDGRGFNPQETWPGHIGVQVMNERIRKIGGTLEIRSAPGSGTTVTAIWIEDGDD